MNKEKAETEDTYHLDQLAAFVHMCHHDPLPSRYRSIRAEGPSSTCNESIWYNADRCFRGVVYKTNFSYQGKVEATASGQHAVTRDASQDHSLSMATGIRQRFGLLPSHPPRHLH